MTFAMESWAFAALDRPISQTPRGWSDEQLAAAVYGSMILGMGLDLPSVGPFATLEPWQRDCILAARRSGLQVERWNFDSRRSFREKTSSGDFPWDADCCSG